MDNKDIISILFDKIEDDGLFDFDNSEKDELDSEVTVLSKRISKYMQNNLSQKNKKKLNKLFIDYSLATASYYHKENELFFKNGVAIGIKFSYKCFVNENVIIVTCSICYNIEQKFKNKYM